MADADEKKTAAGAGGGLGDVAMTEIGIRQTAADPNAPSASSWAADPSSAPSESGVSLSTPASVDDVDKSSLTLRYFGTHDAPTPALKWEDVPLHELPIVVNTDLRKGVSHEEAHNRLIKNGPNELKGHKRAPLWKIFLANFSNLLMILLMVSAIVSMAVGEYAEGIAILVIIFINASLATYTEKSSGDALQALLQMTSPTCNVRRWGALVVTHGTASATGKGDAVPLVDRAHRGVAASGAEHGDLESGGASGDGSEPSAPTVINVPSRELVVGDVVLLESGNVIPADIRLIEALDCRVDESMLTGESVEVRKDHLWRPKPSGRELSPVNMLFSGTHMATGRAVGVVVATGMNTRIGRIAALLMAKKDEDEEEEGASPSVDIDEEQPLAPDAHRHHPSAPSASPPPHHRLMSRGVGLLPSASSRDIADVPSPARPLSVRQKRLQERRKMSERLQELEHDIEEDVPETHPHALVAARAVEEETRESAEQRKEAEKRKKQATLDKKADDKVAKEKKKKKKTKEETPMQCAMHQLGLFMSVVALIACIIVFIIGVARGYEDPSHPDSPTWLVMLLTSVSLAVSAIPEGLPLAVTICLAMGSTRLARAKTLVRQLPAVENLGMTTVICSDKTGTITQGKMTATYIYTQEKLSQITGKGFATEGQVLCDGADMHSWPESEQLGVYLSMLLGGILCNNTRIVLDEVTNKTTIKGSMTEAPLVVAAAKVGLEQSGEMEQRFAKLDEIPFNSARKLMATLHKNTLVAKQTPTASSSRTLLPSIPETTPMEASNSSPNQAKREDTSVVGIHMDPMESTAVSSNRAPRPGRDDDDALRSALKSRVATSVDPNFPFPHSDRVLNSPYFSAVKGAPNYVVKACTRVLQPDGSIAPLDAEQRNSMMMEVDALSSQALRVLAIAFKPFDQLPYHRSESENDSGNARSSEPTIADRSLGESNEDISAKLDLLSEDLVFVGFIASMDPARDGIQEAIETARSAGIRTIMITGDYLLTAVAIAKSIGLIPFGADAVGGMARDAKDLRLPNGTYVSDVQVDDMTSSTVVFARATPEDKLVIVRSLQRLGHTVAMTGDGTNDAPSLKAADIGIAMGSGTAVAQQASNMVIVDDSFPTIVEAIRHGRAIYANIQKFVLFLLGTNSVQVILILLSVAIGVPIPLSPLSILFINLATDGLSAVALSMEHGERELMTLAPRRPGEPILYGVRLVMLLAHAVSLAIAMMLIYLLGLWWYTGHLLGADLQFGTNPALDGLGTNNCKEFVDLQHWVDITDERCKDGIARARTMVFLVITIGEILRGYTVRNWLRGGWHGITTNPTMVFGSILSCGLMLLFVLAPGARDVFGLSHRLPYYGWLISIAAALAVAIVDEWVKQHYNAQLKEKKRWKMMEASFQLVVSELRTVTHKLNGIERYIDQINSRTKGIAPMHPRVANGIPLSE